jgi:hypothetical protein
VTASSAGNDVIKKYDHSLHAQQIMIADIPLTVQVKKKFTENDQIS